MHLPPANALIFALLTLGVAKDFEKFVDANFLEESLCKTWRLSDLPMLRLPFPIKIRDRAAGSSICGEKEKRSSSEMLD